MKWVETKDKLPRDGAYVLIVWQKAVQNTAYYKYKDTFFSWHGDYELPVKEITHWMLWPGKPKKFRSK